MSKQTTVSLWRFWSPYYWPSWLGIAFLWTAAKLPYPAQLFIGHLLGALIYRLMRKRRRIAKFNIDLCFPEKSELERQTLLVRHIKSMGMAIIELAMTWWGPEKQLQKLVHIEGIEHLHHALQKNKGVLLLSAHFTTLEIGGRLLVLTQPMAVMYRKYKNPLFSEILRRVRNRLYTAAILQNNIRGLVKGLKQNNPVWYAPDHNYQRKYCVFVPFFNVQTATITTTSRIAKLSGAEVVPFFQERLPGTKGYRLIFQPALKGFPSDDIIKDTARINKIIEDQVRKVPEQYFWVHERFRKLPDRPESRYKLAGI